ncbi:MAG: polyhydroxyalkanoate synthesis repressor PhaR [Hyphomicrobiaceae bacterium]
MAVDQMLKKAETTAAKMEPVVVKKYANRRLYNTDTSTYVTLDDLAAMVRAERDFVVFDAKSGEDLTHSVLTQIIVEQESRAGGQTLLPVPFLRQLIRFYGDTMERMVPSYLQVSLEALTKEQERFRKQFTTAFTPQGAFDAYQDQARKNLAMFEKAMSMFTPFSQPTKGPAGAGAAEPMADQQAAKSASKGTAGEPTAGSGGTASGAAAAGSGELDELKTQLAAMQVKLEKLAKEPGKS